jgi:hypothetical protein
MDKLVLQDLKTHLSNNPQIEKIFFNAAGQWVFHTTRPGFTIEHSREEVLSDKFEGPTGEEVAKATAEVKTGKKTTLDLIANINAAKTKEEATAAAEGDGRKTVVTALETKLAELAEEV